MPAVGAFDDGDGYVSPEFDLPSDSDDKPEPPIKRARGVEGKASAGRNKSLADDEQLALQLLKSKR